MAAKDSTQAGKVAVVRPQTGHTTPSQVTLILEDISLSLRQADTLLAYDGELVDLEHAEAIVYTLRQAIRRAGWLAETGSRITRSMRTRDDTDHWLMSPEALRAGSH